MSSSVGGIPTQQNTKIDLPSPQDLKNLIDFGRIRKTGILWHFEILYFEGLNMAKFQSCRH